ncbi:MULTISPECIES: hypothetical protein [unclassified Streptomyces]|uniref:Secreted protein n=1 Tax=Streptomyces sp. NBC_00119 TaxID=2975659 RepID=A0AAU1UAI2_9ACTN|nr:MULTISPECIES: hypothetical protein [unclassified Streptomyces]MCX4645167.1 hypothetical protein [Streptomyces sp. NBC_01446]MCX5326065.1 hypothetical protein [Streptomyces sp. NBC_00120]
MPRPTAAQLAYGSATVIFSTLAMLLLSQTSSGLGVAVIALAALGLGLLVALTVPLSKSRPAAAPPSAAEERVPVRRTTVPSAAAPQTTPTSVYEVAPSGTRGPAGP